MLKPRITTKPPKLAPLVGRASPRGSKNYGGLNKGIDMPNETQQPEYGSATAPYKHETEQKGVIDFGGAPKGPFK